MPAWECEDCDGTGEVDTCDGTTKCDTCSGTGEITGFEEERDNPQIPAKEEWETDLYKYVYGPFEEEE
jgi:RecJ-like exonuclease